MFNHHAIDIAVLGAGPVGLVAAHALADKGMDFVLFDNQQHNTPHSHAVVLHPETLELLSSYVLIEDILSHSTRLDRVLIFDGTHNERAAINYDEVGAEHSFLAVIGQKELEALLLKSLAQKGYRPLWHHRVRCIEQTGHDVEFTVDRLIEGSTGYAVSHIEMEIDKILDYQANYMIAADGMTSNARRAAGIGSQVEGNTLYYVVFEIETEVELMEEMRIIVDDDKTHVFLPLGDDRYRFSFQVDPVTTDRVVSEAAGFKKHTEREYCGELSETHLDELLEKHAPCFLASLKQVTWRSKVSFEKRIADSFGANRIWLVGDAAHTTSLLDVLSMNIGMYEAADLVERLGIGPSHEIRQYNLRTFNEQRREEWKRILNTEHHITYDSTTPKWLAAHHEGLIENLPISGKSLNTLLHQIRFSEAVH